MLLLVTALHDELFLPGPLLTVGTLLVGAVLANLCFLAGPAAEAYLAWLGVRSRLVTVALFVAGVVVSLPLTLMFLLAAFGWTIG